MPAEFVSYHAYSPNFDLIVPEAIPRLAPRATGVFPLGFVGQLELSTAHFFVELLEELLAVVPTDCSTGFFGPLNRSGCCPSPLPTVPASPGTCPGRTAW